MPWFDLIHSGLLHQPDANEEAKRFLDQKAAENAAAVTGGAPGATPPVAPAGPPIGAAQPGPGEPQAYQTPKSWGSILMDLSQQNQQEAQFNRSLGGIFGTLSQPINRERVSHTFDTQPMDPLQFGKTAMDLGSQQQGQDRVNQIAKIVNDPVQGPALALKMGLDWGVLKAGILTDPGMLGRVATVMATPTTGQREFAAAQAAIEKQVKLEHPTWSPAEVQAEVNRQAPPSMMLSGIGNIEDQDYRRYVAEERAAGRVPLDSVAWKTHTKNVTETQDEAVTKLPGLTQRIDETNTVIDRIKSNPKLDAALTYLSTTGVAMGVDQAATLAAAATKAGTMDTETYKAIEDIQLLSGQVYSEGFNASGTRRTQAEVAAIVSGLSQLKATGMSGKDYIEKVLSPLQGHMRTAKNIGRQQAGLPAEEEPKKDESFPTPSSTQVEKLKANPDRASEFDQMFGPGASAKILGR